MRAQGSETGHIVAQLHVSPTHRGGQVHNVSAAISDRYSLEPFIQSRHPQYSSTLKFVHPFTAYPLHSCQPRESSVIRCSETGDGVPTADRRKSISTAARVATTCNIIQYARVGI
jgi:hypothetical protein